MPDTIPHRRTALNLATVPAAQATPARGNAAATTDAGNLVWHADQDAPLQHGNDMLEWDTRKGRSTNLKITTSDGARLWMQTIGSETWLFQQSHKGQRLSYALALMHGERLSTDPGPFIGVFFKHGLLCMQAYAKDPATGNPVNVRELDRIDTNGGNTLTLHNEHADRGALTAVDWCKPAVNSLFDLPWSCPP